jgi:hypothetical protein
MQALVSKTNLLPETALSLQQAVANGKLDQAMGLAHELGRGAAECCAFIDEHRITTTPRSITPDKEPQTPPATPPAATGGQVITVPPQKK